ncbi:MAG: sugar porter family MFS transporter [Proteobacteria bacterium]|nr:sugar porter family MFS transporter [Pseudomonadota bacterium]
MAMKNHFYIVIAIIAALSGVLFGYDTGVISGAILFIKDEFNLSPEMNGLVVSAVLFGALLGAMISGRITDRFGRKRLLIADAIIFIFGTLGSCLAPSISSIVVSRIFVGIAIGIASYIAPLYISEIAPAKYRGALVSLNQLAITIGILISYIVDAFFAEAHAWRWMLGMGIVPAMGLLIGMLFLPYSPRWLMSQGRELEALATLEKISGKGTASREQFASIKASLQQQKGDWRMLFSSAIRPALWIASGLALLQQITGINTIIYYAPTIFRMAGFASASSAISTTTIVGVVFVLFTIIALPLVDSLGRRFLLFAGLIATSISLGIISWSFHTHNPSDTLKWLTLISMLVFIAGFAISLGPIMWLMIAEVFPLKVRGLGASLATCINWGSNWLVAITFLTMVHKFGMSGTFGIYFVISIISILFVHSWVPETKGCSLETIEANLYAGKSPRRLGEAS